MKNKKAVLDASAVIALLNNESGSKEAEKYLNNAVISSVNYCEVASCMLNMGVAVEELEGGLQSLFQEIIDFDFAQATLAATLREETKKLGLSLGDRACLALGITENCPVVTADKAWSKLSLDLGIVQIR